MVNKHRSHRWASLSGSPSVGRQVVQHEAAELREPGGPGAERGECAVGLGEGRSKSCRPILRPACVIPEKL